MTPSPSQSQGLEPRRPRSAHTQTVSVNIAESTTAGTPPARRFQLHVSECVETKTVTTTTRLTRKFPQVFIRDPAPLESLDTKEYPLAMKPTPPELADFSYSYDGADDEDDDADAGDLGDADEGPDSQLVSGFQPRGRSRIPFSGFPLFCPVLLTEDRVHERCRSEEVRPPVQPSSSRKLHPARCRHPSP